MDRLSKEERSALMASVRSYDNKSTECRMASIFRANGITGWRRKARIFGKPDFVFPGSKVAVFVDGCFWHGCPRHSRVPKTRTEFWKNKIMDNMRRDRAVARRLRGMGWRVIRVWECALVARASARTLARILRAVQSTR